MTRQRSAAQAVVVGAIVALGVSGCGSSNPEPPAPEPSAVARPSLLPPRPTDLRVDDGFDMCQLLTPAQRTALKIDSAYRYPDPGRLACSFDVGDSKRAYSWVASFERPRNVEEAARGEGATVVQFGGFPAVGTRSSVFEAAYNCTYLVDVASEQSLNISYINTAKDIPGMNHELACQQDAKVAEMIVGNLRAQAH